MKKIFAILIALLCYCTSVFANPQEAISSFTAMISHIKTEIEKTYTDDYAKIAYMKPDKYNSEGYWYKNRKGALEVSYDIKKTDSLISPYTGILNISYRTLHYFDANNPKGHFKTREEATMAASTIKDGDAVLHTFVYSYQDNQWIATKCGLTMFGNTSWSNLKAKDNTLVPIGTCKNLTAAEIKEQEAKLAALVEELKKRKNGQ